MVQSVDKRIAFTLLIIGPLASLAVSPIWNYDPINLIKLLLVSSCAFYCCALLLSNYRHAFEQIPNVLWIASTFFIMALISTMLFSGAPIEQQIWGTFGRNTGFLTYFSLIILLLAASFVEKKDFHKSLVNSIVITSIPMTAYCLIQVAQLDPIGWSEKHPFGTLGNINFSSAFFGLSTLCALALVGEKSYSKVTRIFLFTLVVTDLLIILSTNSIQGLMMFVAGAGIQFFIFLRKKFNSMLLNFGYLLIGLLSILLTILGLTNRGPLAKFLFAPSIVFRTDYWHAGWAMTLKFPIFGVGLDSYGDWYRTLRGEISTLRTGPDRISNTAHNIFLDLSSNGGIPLIFAYLFLLVLAFRCGIQQLRRNPTPHFIALFTSWIGFLIFSSISIAQVGVGIWGWLFTGALIGSSRINKVNREFQNNIQVKKKKRNRKPIGLSPLASLLGFAGLIVGFTLAYIPFQADVKFKTAIQQSSFEKLYASVQVVGSTAFHKESVLDMAIKNNLGAQAKIVATELVTKYPRDFMGWKALSVLNNSSPEEKSRALSKLRMLDPFNPDLK